MSQVRLTYVGPNHKNISKFSAKFWFIKLLGNSVEIRFGKIGSRGTVKVKPFGSPAEARGYFNDRIIEQKSEGYVSAA